MKRILFLLFLLSSITYSQTLKGILSITPIEGSGDETVLSKKAKKPLFLTYSYSKNKSIQELISNEGTTIDTSYISDERIKDQKIETKQTISRPHETFIYKNFDLNIYRFENSQKADNLETNHISIKDSIPLYNWELKDGTQTIAGFTCKKALTKRNLGRSQNITAWYSEDLPINDGPKEFSGLPGLILQIEVGSKTIIKFEELKYIKDEVIEIKEPKNNVEMLTIKQYIKKMRNGG